jgi:hypothetical protein
MTLIFSKDRPMQLQALLESLEWACPELVKEDIFILAKGESYKDKFFSKYKIIYETDFYKQLYTLINNPYYDTVMFLVDDTIFVQKCCLKEIEKKLQNKDVIGVSLRLGENTKYCYMLKSTQCAVRKNSIIDWTLSSHDYAYPMEVSSSVYRLVDIRKLMEPCRNPNEFELILHKQRNKNKNLLESFDISRAFSIPINVVQELWKNTKDLVSAQDLIKKYNNGKRINTEGLRGFIPNSVHQIVNLF